MMADWAAARMFLTIADLRTTKRLSDVLEVYPFRSRVCITTTDYTRKSTHPSSNPSSVLSNLASNTIRNSNHSTVFVECWHGPDKTLRSFTIGYLSLCADTRSLSLWCPSDLGSFYPLFGILVMDYVGWLCQSLTNINSPLGNTSLAIGG